MVILRTARLVLRRLTMADVDNLVELDSDAEVMRFLNKRLPRDTVERELLPRLVAEYGHSPGFGVWAAEVEGRFQGWLSLRVTEDRPVGDAELGYRLRRAVWGQGLATEGSSALVKLAFTTLGVERVWRVMAKAGLRFVRTFHLEFEDPNPGTEFGEVEYAVTRAEWVQACAASGSG